jgi:hypothetical protein
MSNGYPYQARTYHAEVLPGPAYHAPSGQPPPPSRSNKAVLWFVLGCGGILLLLCCGGAGVGGYYGYRIVAAEKPGIDATLTSYFNDAKNKDFNAAYNRMSSTAQQKQSKEQFVAVLSAQPWQSFDKFDSYQTTGIRVFWSSPGAGGGMSAAVNGAIRFNDGRTGTFSSTLEKQGEEWRILGIHVTAPVPAK